MSTKNFFLASLTLSFALAAAVAHADVAPPPCENMMPGAACTTPAGESGVCVPDASGALSCVVGSGGAGGGSTTTTSTTTTTGAGGASGGDDEDDGGCSFAAPTPVTGAGLGLVLGLGALLIGRRRRRS